MPDVRNPANPEINRRKHVRFHPAECELFVAVEPGPLRRLLGRPKNVAVGVYDLSEGGMRLAASERMAGGARVQVRFRVRKFNDEVALAGNVAWCSQHAYRENQFVVGITFGAADAAAQRTIAAMRGYFTSPQFRQKSDTRARLNPESDLKKLEFDEGRLSD